MFRGRYEHTIDAKGRTSLPARYRDVLSSIGERRIILTSALDPCLVAYTVAGVERVRGEAREAAAVRSRRSEAEAHLRVGRGRVRGRRLRAASSSRRRCAITRGSRRTCSGRAAASTPSSGTRRPVEAVTSRRPTTSARRSARASRSSAYEQVRRSSLSRDVAAEAAAEWVWSEETGEEIDVPAFVHATVMRDGGRRRARARRAGVYVDATLGGGGHSEGDPRGHRRGARRSRSIATTSRSTAARERLARFGDRVTLREDAVRRRRRGARRRSASRRSTASAPISA